MTEAHRLELGTSLAEVTRLNRWFDALVSAESLAETLGNEIKLCLNEAVTNALSYGFQNRVQGRIVVSVRLGTDQVAVDIHDTGAAFDPTEFDATPVAGTIEDARIGGLGVLLIKEFARSVSYARVDGENVLSLVFERREA